MSILSGIGLRLGWSLGLAPHLSLLDVNLVSDEHDGDVLADADQVAVPVGHRLVRDARGDVEHDDGALPLDAEDKKKKAPGGTRGACQGPDGVVKTRTQNHSQGTRRRAQAVRRRVAPGRVKDGTLRAAGSRRRGSARWGQEEGSASRKESACHWHASRSWCDNAARLARSRRGPCPHLWQPLSPGWPGCGPAAARLRRGCGGAATY